MWEIHPDPPCDLSSLEYSELGRVVAQLLKLKYKDPKNFRFKEARARNTYSSASPNQQ